MMHRLIALAVAGLLAAPALAQTPPPRSEQPAVRTTGPAAAPAAAPAPAPAPNDSGGTRVFGENESPIGLIIMPWRNAMPEADIDRPARLLAIEMTPLDRKVFARQVEYYEALTAAQKSKTTAAPAAAAPAP